MTNKFKKNNGISIIGVLFFGFIIILFLSYFKISIRSIIEDPLAQENITYVGGGARNLWNDYLKEPASFIWDETYINILKPILSSIISSLEQSFKDSPAPKF